LRQQRCLHIGTLKQTRWSTVRQIRYPSFLLS
jgi:hypothetical protein